MRIANLDNTIKKSNQRELDKTSSLPLSLSLSVSQFYMEKARKSLKERFSKFLLRSACSNTTTSTSTSTRLFKRLPKQPPQRPDQKPNPNTARKVERHLSLPWQSDRAIIHVTIDCAGRHSVDAAVPSVKCKRKKQRRLTETGSLYETGDCEGRKCPPASPYSSSNHTRCLSKSERFDKGITRSRSYALSSSSSVGSQNENEPEFFSSDREKQEIISSRSFSFSSESSEFHRRRNIFARESRCRKEGIEEVQPEQESGFAVVKRSLDPYKDFRNSMVDMILETRINAADDMRRLLESYLHLNSPEHHPIIVSAFADVWDAIFPNS